TVSRHDSTICSKLPAHAGWSSTTASTMAPDSEAVTAPKPWRGVMRVPGYRGGAATARSPQMFIADRPRRPGNRGRKGERNGTGPGIWQASIRIIRRQRGDLSFAQLLDRLVVVVVQRLHVDFARIEDDVGRDFRLTVLEIEAHLLAAQIATNVSTQVAFCTHIDHNRGNIGVVPSLLEGTRAR